MAHPLESVFPGGGEMARLCRSFDWASTSLGPPGEWPLSLRTLVATLLGSGHPMLLFWGPDLIQIYNDAYRPSLGSGGHHPGALGASAREVWTDLWDVIGPQVEQVRARGEATWHEDQPVPLERDGGLDETWWTYSYGPAFGDDGSVEGVLVVCQETTARVRVEAEARRTAERMTQLVEGMGEGFFTLDADWRFTLVNAEAERILERSREELLGRVVWDAFPEAVGTTSQVEYERAVNERVAVAFEQFFPPLDRWFRVRAYPLDDGLTVHFEDVTEARRAEEALRSSERRFRELAESMPLMVWTADDAGAVDYQTEAVLQYTGATRDELAGSGWLDVIHPDDRDHTVAVWSAAVERLEPYQVQFRIRGSDGAYRWFLTRAVPVEDPEDGGIKWYGTATDIHDQHEAAREVEALAERLTTTLESITDAFYLLDREWRFRFLNNEAERVLERARGEVLGEVLWEAFPEVRGSGLERRYRRAMTEGTTASLRYFYAPLSRWFDIRAYPSHEGLAVYFRDVTAEREADRKLHEQAALLDAARDAILLRDLDHGILYWNAGAERTYGWTSEEAAGKSVRDLLYENPVAFDEATARTLETGEWHGELEHRTRDGTTIAVEGRWSLLRDDEGRPERILAINTDVTDRKRLLAQFLRSQRMESIGTLAGGIAHDLNNVLAPILLSLGMLKLDVDDPEQLETLDTIEASAQRGADMVRQVLAFARGVEGAQVAVDVESVLDDLDKVVRDSFPRNISLRRRLAPDLWPVSGDPTQVHQVLMNLLLNARDAMPKGGTLTVSAGNVELDAHYAAMSPEASPGPYVRVSVADTGSGMPPDVVDQIFDPFFTTKEVGRGSGLGLSTVAAIVRSHHGFINVYSEPGSGTTFRIYLPAETSGTAEPAAGPAETLPRGNGETVLVVDDERAVREITRQTLEAFGYTVMTAMDGAEAVALYGRDGDRIAVVLTDMMMPIMDGPTAIRALQRMDPEVRIIAASGWGANGGAARDTDSHVRHFLPKPYTAETLLRTIRAVLEE